MQTLILKVFIFAFALCWSGLSWSGLWDSSYDWKIKKAARRWLPTYDPLLYKAQLIVESGLNPNAVSPANAKGIAQFMPPTWREWQSYSGTDASAFDADQAIEAGAWYMARMWSIWTSPRPARDRQNLAAASYNAGAGHIIKSQRLCGNPAGYDPIMACLDQVTGHHAAETRAYAPRMRRIYARLLLL